MNETSRPDPDQLLSQLQDEQKKSQRGRLKIFFGSSAGVGKTYAMLKAAHEQMAQGKNVLVGLIETHARSETEALLEGLMLLPPREIKYRGLTLKEFDLDTALTRHPEILLVDELAHTNAPESRHPKRWNDVEELLNAGIDVFTTLNVQHIESLSDLVAGTTGVWVKETIPDRLFDTAEDVVLVDIDEDDLLQRLHEGKVYVAPGAMARASENFFKKPNLSALRELALRRTADRVGAERGAAPFSNGAHRSVADKILVCVDAQTLSTRLIRSAKRLATGLRAPWIAVTVEKPSALPATQEERRYWEELERMIERMGGKFVTLHGEAIAPTLLAFARKEHVTKIIVGRYEGESSFRLFRESVIASLVRASGSIDIYIVTDKNEESKARPAFQRSVRAADKLGDYLIALAVILVLSLPGLLVPHVVNRTDQALFYLAGIVPVAGAMGIGPSLFYVLFSALALQFFFPALPGNTLLSAGLNGLLTFGMMLGAGGVVALQSSRLRNQALFARQKEDRSLHFFEISRKLSSSYGRFPVSQVVAQHIAKTMGFETTIWMTNEEGHPAVVLGDLPEATYHKDFGALEWCFENGQNAGLGTETMPSAAGAYFPLIGAQGALGVLGVFPRKDERILDSEQRSELETLTALLASALERVRSSELVREAMLEKERTRLRSAFLEEAGGNLPSKEAYEASAPLPEKISSAAFRAVTGGLNEEHFKLNKSIRRFLSAAAGEIPAPNLSRRPTSLADRMQKVLARLKELLVPYRIENGIPTDLPDILVDLAMCEEALSCYLLFLAHTSPEGARLGLTATREGGQVFLTMTQERSLLEGGLKQEFFERLVPPSQEADTIPRDLGIAASLIRLHGGSTKVAKSEDGSASVKVGFPIA